MLITGCSSGIGKQTALALKERGYDVFAAARSEEDLQALRALGLTAVRLDVNDADSIQQALKEILQQTGGTLDALFNNAGFLRAGAIEDLNRELIRAQFETNVFGPMELVRLVLPIMRQQGHGRIIQNSSILGVVCIPLCGAYNASKHALEGFSNTLRQELRGSNIHVAIINPGPIVSKLRDNAYELHQAYGQQADFSASPYADKYQLMEKSYFKPSKTDQKLAQSPDAVVKKVIHALESKNPCAHYYIGMPAQGLAILRRLLPDKMLDWLMCKFR